MRVLMVHGSAELYGSDQACLAVARAAVQAGIDVEVIVPTSGPLVAALDDAGAVTTILDPLVIRRADLRWPTAAVTPTRWARAALGLWRHARGARLDLVHSNTSGVVGGALVARRLGLPHIWHVHELFWQPRPIVMGFERLLRSARFVICCSQAVADQFADPRVRQRCVVAYTGVFVPSDIATTVPLTGPGLDVVCVARINEWKGQEVLVEALAEVAARRGRTGLRLRLVGGVFRSEHHYREALEARIAELGVADLVVLEGERPDALELVGSADVFVLPSRRPEPFGMALVEAMALGRPVVATDAGGPAEIVTPGVDGLLVPPNNPSELATAILQLAGDPDAARRMGAAARQRADDFSLESMAEAVLATWLRAVDEPTPGR